MNLYELKGRWNQLRGRLKEQWGKLSDNDLVAVRGRRDRLVGRIQELYGIARGKVERQLARLERLLQEERPAMRARRPASATSRRRRTSGARSRRR